MAEGSSPPERWSRNLSAAVRGLRRSAGLRAAEVAERMNMPLRSYEHFEAGGGRVSLERLHAFAQALDCDPMALIAAILIGSPQLAIRCRKNKMMLTLMLALREFDDDVGDGIELVETGVYLAAFSSMFADLAKEAGERRALALEVERRSRESGLTTSRTASEASAEIRDPNSSAPFRK